MLVYLEITSWRGISLGAMHYYGSITVSDENYTKTPLTRKITKAVQKELAEQDGEKYLSLYRVGEETERWKSKALLRRAAIKWFEQNYSIEDSMLIEGSSSTAEPQKVICGLEPFKSAINELWEQREKLEWDTDEEELDRICNDWNVIIKPFRQAKVKAT